MQVPVAAVDSAFTGLMSEFVLRRAICPAFSVLGIVS